MSDAPIWSTKVMGNSELEDVPLQPLSPSTGDIWSMDDFMGVDAKYYHGKGLNDSTRPGGLVYANAEARDAGLAVQDLLGAKDIFKVGSLVFLSSVVKDALADVDLGDGRLTRMPIFRADRKTEFDVTFYLLEFSNARETVDRERTDRCRPLYKARPEAGFKLPSGLEGRDVFVHRAAEDGPELWFDPMIRHYQFVSDRVARALIALGLRDEFKLNQCKYLDAP